MSFLTDGYEVQPLFSPEQVAQLRGAISRYMDRVSKTLFKQPEDTEAGAAFDRRIELVARRDQSLASLIATAVATDGHRDPEVSSLARDARLFDLAAHLAGCEIEDCVFRFRVNSPSLPDSGQLWHSDVVRTSGPCSSVVATAWVALNDPISETGGLEIVPGQRFAPVPHSQVSGKIFIPPKQLEGQETISPAIPAGTSIFLAPFTPHRSAAIEGRFTRWSLVVWLRGKGQPRPSEESLREIFALNLKRLRKERGFTQKQLAVAASLNQAYVSSLEQKRHGAGIDTIQQLAIALDVEVNQLIATECVTGQ